MRKINSPKSSGLSGMVDCKCEYSYELWNRQNERRELFQRKMLLQLLIYIWFPFRNGLVMCHHQQIFYGKTRTHFLRVFDRLFHFLKRNFLPLPKEKLLTEITRIKIDEMRWWCARNWNGFLFFFFLLDVSKRVPE